MTTNTRRTYNARLRELAKEAGVRRVNVTLAPAEYQALSASAKHFDERVTTHLKRCALAHLEAKYLVPPNIEERLDAFIAIVRGIGNNLNQLARHSNETRMFLDTEDVRGELRRMEDAVRAFLVDPARGESPSTSR